MGLIDDDYRDGDFEYTTIETLIEEIVDRYGVKAYVYVESDAYDNVMTTTMVQDGEDDEHCEALQFNALLNLVIDITKDREGDDRNAVIAEIYDRVYQAIHADDDEDENEGVEW